MRYYRLIIIVFLLNLSWTITIAQQHLFNAEHITIEDGLASLSIYGIYQDHQGFIWMGTKFGLIRYDGYSFKHFNTGQSENNSDIVIYDIYEDENGNLWVRYNEEDGHKWVVLNPQTEQSVPFETYFKNQLPLESDELRTLNKNWAETKGGELYFYRNRQFKKVMEDLPFPISSIEIDLENNTWIGGKRQLIQLDSSLQVLQHVKMEDLPFQISTINIDNENNIWLKGEEQLIQLDSSLQIVQQVEMPHSLGSIWFGKDNRLWVNTHTYDFEMGMKNFIWTKAKNEAELTPFYFTKNGKKVENIFFPYPYTNNKNDPEYWYCNIDKHIEVFDGQGRWLFDFNSLIGMEKKVAVRSILKLDETVWFTSDNGIVKTEIRKPLFQEIGGNSATILNFRGITEGPNGNIYFLNDYLYEWNPSNNIVQKHQNWFGNHGIIYSDSIVWTGHNDKKILGGEIDLRTNQKTFYPAIAGELAYTTIEFKTPKKYLIGHSGGLSYLDLNNKIPIPFEGYNEFKELKELDVFHLHRNDSGIWIATNKGVFLMTEERGILQHFDKSSGHLPFNYIIHIYEDKAGVFWLASGGGGLIRWKPNLDSSVPSEYRQFTTIDGLSHNYLYAVYGDLKEQLWISSERGLMRVNKNTFQVRTYTTKDGLPHDEFNFTSHYQSKNGQLYFGSLAGVITFHPDSILIDSAYDASLKFIACQILKEGDEEMTDLMDILTTSEEIVIEASDKLLEIKFALLDFDNPKNHRYTYKIKGYTDYWRNIEENFIHLNNLPHGDYEIRIRGININKGQSEQELTLNISVLKPFYLQWWFMLSVILLLAGLIITFIKRREFNLKNDRKRLETEVKKRTQKIEEDKEIIEAQAEKLKQLDKAKTRFFSNITHEFRTPLTLIIGPLEQVIENQPPPNIFKRRLNGVLNNAKHLLTLINQMLDLSKIESGSMKTEVIKGDIINYTREFVKRFEPLIEKKEHRFKFVSNQESWKTHFDKDKWDKIIYNLLSNALKFTPKGEVIQLSLMKTVFKEKEAIRLDVKDTGVGIKKNQLDQIFNRFYQADDSSRRKKGGTGIGLALVKELVELQGGEIWVSSRVNKGTSFEIYLPVLDYEKRIVEQTLEVPTLSILNKTTEKTTEQFSVPTSKKEGKLELLIIEDNEEIREYIQYCLDTSKYNITEAVNGEDGVLKAQSIVPDLIISDVMMPRKNGFQVVEEIRDYLATSHIPIILLTAKASLESRLEGLKRGADAYLTKPFSPQELALRIEKLIELRQIIQQRYQNNLSNLPSSEKETFQKEDQFIIELKAYILENIENAELSVDEIGRNFGMSRVHLYRKLKALTNQSTSVFVRQIRLERAKELLKEGELNISEITYQTGFASVSYFSRSFKKVYGVAPSEM